MVELQILNKVLAEKSLRLINQHGLDERYFIQFQVEYGFIMDHYMKYGSVPDTETFMMQFNTFDLLNVGEADQYLIETIREQFMYSQMVPFVNNLSEMVTGNAVEAVNYLVQTLPDILKLTVRFQAGYDIIKNAPDRGDEYTKRSEIDGLLGITSGIDEFDAFLHGWLPGEDLIIILGRTNEGKTWVMLFFLVAAWAMGKRILFYSGEMPKNMIGFRFDTLHQHFSNMGLLSGNEALGSTDSPMTGEDYTKYIESLSQKDIPFIVVTPKDLGGKRLTAPMLDNLIEYYKPDMVGVDQLSLMDDARKSKGDQERTQYTHIAEDLYLISEKRRIPIMTPAQANRSSVSDKKDGGEDTPKVHQIQESDGIGQNATRVIGMKQIGNTLKLSIEKNRYGPKDKEILLLWDIDKGIIRPFLQVSTAPGSQRTTEARAIGAGLSGEDLF